MDLGYCIIMLTLSITMAPMAAIRNRGRDSCDAFCIIYAIGSVEYVVGVAFAILFLCEIDKNRRSLLMAYVIWLV